MLVIKDRKWACTEGVYEIGILRNDDDPVSYTHLDVYKRQIIQTEIMTSLKINFCKGLLFTY